LGCIFNAYHQALILISLSASLKRIKNEETNGKFEFDSNQVQDLLPSEYKSKSWSEIKEMSIDILKSLNPNHDELAFIELEEDDN